MKLGVLLGLALFFGFASVCSAADNGKNVRLKYVLPSAQLGDYSLRLDTTAPKPLDSPDPGALTDLKRDTIRPFIGFSLSRPISDDFWKFGR